MKVELANGKPMKRLSKLPVNLRFDERLKGVEIAEVETKPLSQLEGAMFNKNSFHILKLSKVNLTLQVKLQ